MRIAILSGDTGWHVRDLIRASGELGHSVQAIDSRTLAAGVETSPVPLADFDVALVRTLPAGSLEQTIFRLDVLHAAEAQGLPILNPPRAVETCVDKYLTSVRLASAGLPTPPTHIAQRTVDALEAFERLGRDVVIKPLFGAEGRGMQRITDPELAWRTFRVLEQTGQVIYQQQFVPHPGFDLRVLVIGGSIAAAMKRQSAADWRTNVSRGGIPSAVELSRHEAELASSAAEAVGCAVAGVDLLPGPAGERYVIEVNASPGWQAMAPTSGIDVAQAIVRFATEGFSHWRNATR